MSWDDISISALVGRTLTEARASDDTVFLTTADGEQYSLHHDQDCCESVGVEEIIGVLDNLIGTPILLAEEATNRDDPSPSAYYGESYTWTFFKLSTVKGDVTIRFFGSSNGYYSESAHFGKVA